MSHITGGCHCGNLQVEVSLPRSPESYSPRACDCEFCLKHAAMYVSDPEGALLLRVRDRKLLREYKQGSGTADFLLCGECGVLVAVYFADGDGVFGAVNVRSLQGPPAFATETKVSPKRLPRDQKTERWKSVWIKRVAIESDSD